MTGRRTLQGSECPVGRSVDVVGEWWSILIVRDAIEGITRFDDFRQHLGISPTMLTQPLRRLVDTGILSRRRYEDRPPRDEYVLTDRGRDFKPVLVALVAFGKKHFAAPGGAVPSRFAGVFSPPPLPSAPPPRSTPRRAAKAARP